MKFFDILLKEGRKEDLKKKYTDKFKEWPNTLDFILGISDLIDFNHKYTDFVLKNLRPNSSTDDIEDAVELVKDFDKYSSQFPKKDINQYNSLNELRSLVEFVRNKKRDKELENQTEKIYEDDNFLVLVPKTQEASCKYGSGTKWCVTMKDGGHFERYTKGKQGLYFIIRKKGDQATPHYKVAIHMNDNGDETWWDARDQRMNNDAITLFKDYFPEIYSKITEDNRKKRKPNLVEVNKIFEEMDQKMSVVENFKNSGKTLEIFTAGFDRIPDMEGKATGFVKIFLGNELIDAYDVFVSYNIDEKGRLTLSIGFDSFGEFDDEYFTPKFDFEFWKGWGIDGNFNYSNLLTIQEMRQQILDWIASRIQAKIYQIGPFEAYVKNITGPVWRPDRINYGYTFKRADRGLVKKLIDWLDTGKIGTKLDFLVDIGKLKVKTGERNKPLYSHSYSDDFRPSGNFRGYFSSFFASAKNAGILDYRKVGNQFLFKKGPNFEAFKEGKLRAL